MRKWAAGMAGGLAVGWGCPALAQGVSYRFVFQQPQYSIGAGESISLAVYLEEVTSGGAASLLMEEEGVMSIGVRLRRIGVVPPEPVRFAPTNGIAPNTVQFFGPGDPLLPPVMEVSPSGDEARLLVFARTSGVTGSPLGGNTRAVFLGNFVITAGAGLGQTTHIQAEDFGPTSDTITWENLLVLDSPAIGIAPTTTQVTTLQTFCYANCDNSTQPPILNLDDFVCFQARFAAGDVYANCDGSTVAPILNINDFVCFQQRFAAGCP